MCLVTVVDSMAMSPGFKTRTRHWTFGEIPGSQYLSVRTSRGSDDHVNVCTDTKESQGRRHGNDHPHVLKWPIVLNDAS